MIWRISSKKRPRQATSSGSFWSLTHPFLAPCARLHHVTVEEKIVGQVAKNLAGHPIDEIEKMVKAELAD